MRFRWTPIFASASLIVVNGSWPASSQSPTEAPSGLDNKSIEPDQAKFDENRKAFEKVEVIAPDGLGPIYNAQACRECHQTPITGAEAKSSNLELVARARTVSLYFRIFQSLEMLSRGVHW